MDYRQIIGEGAYGKIFERIRLGDGLDIAAQNLTNAIMEALGDMPLDEKTDEIGKILGNSLDTAVVNAKNLKMTEMMEKELANINWDSGTFEASKFGFDGIIAKMKMGAKKKLLVGDMTFELRQKLENIIDSPIYSNYVGWAIISALANIYEGGLTLAQRHGEVKDTTEQVEEGSYRFSDFMTDDKYREFSSKYASANLGWFEMLKSNVAYSGTCRRCGQFADRGKPCPAKLPAKKKGMPNVSVCPMKPEE